MKKTLLAVLALSSLVAIADTWTDPDTGYTWTYSIHDGTAEIRNGFSCAVSPNPEGELTIPSSLGGCPVMSIGSYAFRHCSSLTSATIPDSVTSIEDSAFFGCSKLTSVTIPSSVTSIGEGVFSDCYRLTSFAVAFSNPCYKSVSGLLLTKDGRTLVAGINGDVTIPNGVTSIGKSAFSGYSGLTRVTIPSSVTSIGNYAFYWSGLTSVTIPDSVTSIGFYAFSDCRLTEVTIPNSVTSIGWYAFASCSKLTSVTIPSSATSLAAYVFCDCSSLASVTIPDGVTSIGAYAFDNCIGLTSVTIPNSVTNIGYSAFSDCSGLTNVTIPDSVTSIGAYAFEGCSELTSVTIPDSVTSIGSYAFRGCSGLTSVMIPDRVTSIGAYAFEGCSELTSVTIGNSVTSIGEYAFEGCNELTSVTIPDSVTSIGNGAFDGCRGLVSVTIGDSVASIGAYAFAGCNKIKNVTINQAVCNSHFYTIFQGAYNSITNVIISDSVTSIGNRMFEGCRMLTSVTIGSGVSNIGDRAFSDCVSLMAFNVAADNQYYKSVFGLLLTKDGKTLVASVNGDVTIPDGVTRINAIFYNCDGMTSLAIPGSVTSIVNRAFSNCSSLMAFSVAANSQHYKSVSGLLLTKDGRTLVAGVNGNVTIPDGVTSIENSAFYNRGNLTSVIMPNSVTNIEDSAFYNCGSLTSVTIGANVTSIGSYVFYNCGNLTSVIIPNSVTSLGNYAFCGCSSLTSVTIPNSVTSIGNGVFYGCSGLASVTIGDGVMSIGDDAFRKCGGIMSFVVADDNIAYQSASGLLLTKDGRTLVAGINGDVTIPNGVMSIGESAFSGCSGLTRVTMPGSVTSIGDYAFDGCSGLTSVTIPDSVTSIGNGAFNGCSGLTRATIGNGVMSIKWRAFFGCSGLTSVTIPDGVTNIEEESFFGCRDLRNVTVNQTVCNSRLSHIFSYEEYDYFEGDDGFYSLITNIVISESVTNIGKRAFSGFRRLTSVTMQGDAPAVGDYAFRGVADGCVVRIPRGNETYNVTNGKWQGMTVEYYDPEPLPPVILIDEEKMEEPVDTEEGVKTIAIKGEPLEDAAEITELVESVTISVVVGTEQVNTTAGYNKTYNPVLNQIVITLKEPEVGLAADAPEEDKVDGDATGMLAEVSDENVTLATEPEPTAEEVAAGTTEVGALPVKAVKGLYYQASWGSDLSNMHQGEKVQATGDTLYLGVIKQQATQGFYKVTVSEQ